MTTDTTQKKVSSQLFQELKQALQFISSLRDASSKNREKYLEIGCYLSFVGYPRSGSSLIGALLDAHPDAVVAREVDAFQCVLARFDRYMIYRLILAKSAWAQKRGQEWTNYSYEVAGQWQGRVRTLKVIGDKKAGNSSLLLSRYPNLLKAMPKVFGVPLRFIHPLRNPYDNITTIAMRTDNGDLDKAMERYFAHVKGVQLLKQKVPAEQILDVPHESLTANPRLELQRMCAFLGLDPEPEWLEACAAIVRPQPNLSRFKSNDWTPERIARVGELATAVPFLKDYRFEEGQGA